MVCEWGDEDAIHMVQYILSTLYRYFFFRGGGEKGGSFEKNNYITYLTLPNYYPIS